MESDRLVFIGRLILRLGGNGCWLHLPCHGGINPQLGYRLFGGRTASSGAKGELSIDVSIAGQVQIAVNHLVPPSQAQRPVAVKLDLDHLEIGT